jgi:hypothetical protein
VAAAVLFAFFALLFGPTLLHGRMILIGDPLKQFYPIRMVAWQMIRDGHLPLWTPHILSGYPMSSMIMLGLGYPLTWGYLFLPGHWAEQLFVLAPYFLAPIFTYAFLREWGRSPAASVLGGLTFGYGGFLFSPIGLTGIHANSALWLPLFLLGVARARRRSFIGSLLFATAAYTMSVLAGSAQIFLYGGALALAYGIFLTIFPNRGHDEEAAPPRWQPLAVATGAIVLAVGLTAFQTFQTWTAVNQSVRDAYPAARFGEGSFPPMLAWRSLLQPLGNYWDSSTYVPLVALLLALVALFAAGRRGSHVYFWCFVAVISWLLILGKHTPLFDLYGRVPFVRLFRYPSRHSLEWTFAIAVLAAYGWDIIESWLDRRSRRPLLTIAGAGVFVLIGAFIAVRWREHTIRAGLDAIADLNNVITRLDATYAAWKVAFTLCIAVSLWLLFRLREGPLRRTLLAITAALCCFVEPYLWMVRPVIGRFSVSREMFGSFADATHVLRKHLAGYERTFSVPNPYAVSSEPKRDVDAVNWTALAGMEDVNGYESLILSNYSRALRGVVDTEPFISPDATLMGLDSHVLDLLNVGYVVAYANFSSVPGLAVENSGITFSLQDLGVDVKRELTFSLPAAGAEASSLALVTTLGIAGDVEQGTPVARITIHTADGRVVERDLLAGIHTSELAYDRPDVKAVIRHRLAPIFDSSPGDSQRSFQSHRYLARIDLGERLRVTRVDFVKTVSEAGLGLWKVSLYDATSGKSAPLPQPPLERWRTIYDRNGVVILQNLRVLPRAWLVGSVASLDEEEILHRIRGDGATPFDPRATALLEASARKTPDAVRAFNETTLSAQPASDGEVGIIRDEPSRMLFETTSSRRAMLVVSEVYYPGWAATLDGVPVPIHRTNFLLRGVVVPPGRHTVEMTYRPPGARKGALVSLVTIAIIGVAVRSRKKTPSAPR